MRNWCIETIVDGAATAKKTGPKSENGGFSLVIRQRDQGHHVTAAIISGHADEHGKLWLTVRVNDQKGGAHIIATFDTER